MTPGVTPDLPSLPSDVLGMDRGQGAPGGDARWPPPSLCSLLSPLLLPLLHFLFLDSKQATPSLLRLFQFLLHQSPLLSLENPRHCPQEPGQVTRCWRSLPASLPTRLSHPFYRQKTEAQREREREISELRQQGAEPWPLSFWSRTLDNSRIVIMNPGLALCASVSGSPPVPLPQKVPVVSCCTGPCQFCS